MKTAETLGRMTDAELLECISSNPEISVEIPGERLTKETLVFLYSNLRSRSLYEFADAVVKKEGVGFLDAETILHLENNYLLCRGMHRSWWTPSFFEECFFKDGNLRNWNYLEYAPADSMPVGFIERCVTSLPGVVFCLPRRLITKPLVDIAIAAGYHHAILMLESIDDSTANEFVANAFAPDSKLVAEFSSSELATFVRVLHRLHESDLTASGHSYFEEFLLANC